MIASRFLLMNLITKMGCALFYYIFKLSYTIKTSCEDPTTILWYATYLVAARFLVISQSTTFLFMSFSKVILAWRADLFMSLNSITTVNIATVIGVSIIIIDLGLRVDMHIINDCTDTRLLNMYQTMYKSEMCYVQSYNESEELNSTLFENAKISSTKDSDECIDYPTIKVLVFCIFIFELMKVIMEFLRMIKKFRRKYKQIVIADLLSQPKSVDTLRTDIEIGEINSTVTPKENVQEQNEDLELTNNLPSSSYRNSKPTSSQISSPLESEQLRF